MSIFKVGKGFDCSANQLTTLEGAPKKVGGNFNCSYNQLTDEDIEWLEKNSDVRGSIMK